MSPISDNAVGKVGIGGTNKITLLAPAGISLGKCDGITGGISAFSTTLRSDGRAPVSCTVSINKEIADKFKATTEATLVFDIELNYKYFVESSVDVSVQGTKR